jgi:hypothetical protein
MPLELNPLRMAVQEWIDADDEHRAEKVERLRRLATPFLLHLLLEAYDDALEQAQILQDRYGDGDDEE